MSIEYVEVRDINRELIGIVDTFKSVIWHRVYYNVGDFEVYAKATTQHLELLQEGRYITRPDDIEVGIIEAIQILDDAESGTMIIATGRFGKSLLDRRIIYNLSGKTNKPTILKGNVEQNIRRVVSDNAINCTFDSKRNMPILQLGELSNLTEIIVDTEGNPAQKQVSHDSLLEYTEKVLREYGLTSYVYLGSDSENKRLQYKIAKGIDRSVDNANGLEPVIFSKDYDNLTASDYLYDVKSLKNAVLIGGEGEGAERFYSLISPPETGLARRETWLDTASTNKSLKETELKEMFSAGQFVGVNFVVGGVTYATLVTDLTREYSLNTLKEAFPAGVVNGTKFNVAGVSYATLIYGETETYNLTAIGYKKMLEKDKQEGTYLLVDSVYKSLLDTQGKQALAPLKITETFNGTLNITAGNYILNIDFWLGDIVTVEEKSINKYINVRITETTEVQDENGYKVDAVYE